MQLLDSSIILIILACHVSVSTCKVIPVLFHLDFFFFFLRKELKIPQTLVGECFSLLVDWNVLSPLDALVLRCSITLPVCVHSEATCQIICELAVSPLAAMFVVSPFFLSDLPSDAHVFVSRHYVYRGKILFDGKTACCVSMIIWYRQIAL